MSRLTFEESTHIYTLDGARVPSVTGVLKRSGLIDFSSIPPSILEAAQLRGTTVHRAIHFYNEGDLDVGQFLGDFPEYAGYLNAWIAFCEKRRVSAVLNEHRVASPRHQVTGTLDTLCLLDGDAWLLDFATGRPQDVSKDLQTAAYLHLAYEWSLEDTVLAAFLGRHAVVRRGAVGLRRDGTYRFEPYSDPTDFRKFLTLLDAQRIVDARRGERFEVAA